MQQRTTGVGRGLVAVVLGVAIGVAVGVGGSLIAGRGHVFWVVVFGVPTALVATGVLLTVTSRGRGSRPGRALIAAAFTLAAMAAWWYVIVISIPPLTLEGAVTWPPAIAVTAAALLALSRVRRPS